MDGHTDQLIERFAGLEIEAVALGIAHEQSLALEQTGDSAADGV